MRYVIYGAGAIGGVLGGCLSRAGREVVFIARGDNKTALQEHGLRLTSPAGETVVHAPVVSHPRELVFTDDDVVILATKTQDTNEVVFELASVAPSSVPVICAQNGVENERITQRYFERVIGMYVFIFAAHLSPGAVQYYTHPLNGIADVGPYVNGYDDLVEKVAADLCAAGFDSLVRRPIMPWKYSKLIENLANVIQALCGSDSEWDSPEFELLLRGVRDEAVACLRAAGIDFVSTDVAFNRRSSVLPLREVNGARFPGGSTWQSMARGTGRIETDYLNGEIALLGRLHRVPTPVNSGLQSMVRRVVQERLAPGSVTAQELVAEVERYRGAVLK